MNRGPEWTFFQREYTDGQDRHIKRCSMSLIIREMQILKNIFYWLCHYNCPIFPPLFPSTLHFLSQHPSFPHPPLHTRSSCPWVVHISSSASPFPILFLTSPCLFCAYYLCFLFPVPFPPFSLSPSPMITHLATSISVILFLF